MDVLNYDWPSITNINQVSWGGYALPPVIRARLVDRDTIDKKWKESSEELLKILEEES